MSEGEPPPGDDHSGDLYLPSELETGVYAESVSAWHTSFALVLDFVAPIYPARSGAVDDDARGVPRDQVVARVRVPMGSAFEMIRAVSDMMGIYEREWGEIHRPQPPAEGA